MGHGITKIRAELMSTLAQIFTAFIEYGLVFFIIVPSGYEFCLINFQILNRPSASGDAGLSWV